MVVVPHAHDDSKEDGNGWHGSFSPAVFQADGPIEHQPPCIVVYAVSNKITETFKLEFIVGFGLCQ